MWIEAIGGTLLAVFLGWVFCVTLSKGSRSYRSEDLEEARYEEINH